MKIEIRNKIFFILQELESIEAKYKQDLYQKRKELIELAVHFDNYKEMYSFIKKFTNNKEQFVQDLQDARALRRKEGL